MTFFQRPVILSLDLVLRCSFVPGGNMIIMTLEQNFQESGTYHSSEPPHVYWNLSWEKRALPRTASRTLPSWNLGYLRALQTRTSLTSKHNATAGKERSDLQQAYCQILLKSKSIGRRLRHIVTYDCGVSSHFLSYSSQRYHGVLPEWSSEIASRYLHRKLIWLGSSN